MEFLGRTSNLSFSQLSVSVERYVNRLHFVVCLVNVEAWLKACRLWLNPSKTQVMWLGSAQHLANCGLMMFVKGSQLRVVGTARNLGVAVDRQLSMSAHITAVCRGGYYQLRPLERCMTDEAIKTLTHAFISSSHHTGLLYFAALRLDSCIE